jgi:hypothetical protein
MLFRALSFLPPSVFDEFSFSALKMKEAAGSSETWELCTRLHDVTFQNTMLFIISGYIMFFPCDDRLSITAIKLQYGNRKQIF